MNLHIRVPTTRIGDFKNANTTVLSDRHDITSCSQKFCNMNT